MQSLFFEMNSGRIHALRFGHGEELLIALHGFSDQGKMFLGLEKVLGDRFTVLAIDLPFHGQTVWEKDHFTKTELHQLIGKVLEQEGKSRVSLMGFSFGARLIQGMLRELQPRVDQLFLLSPDGVKTRGLGLANHTPMWIRRMLYKVLKSGTVLKIVKFCLENAWIPDHLSRFATKNLSNPENLQRSFGCWFSMDSFSLRTSNLRAQLKDLALTTAIFVGEKDSILDLTSLKNTFSGLPNVQLWELEGVGHRLFSKALESAIAKTIDAN